MPTDTAVSKAAAYVSARAGAAELGISGHKFLRLVGLGKIRVKAEVGELPKYSAEDIARLKAEAQ